ncbi:hypothetical protein C8R43DRAFT_965704 [Mycena crocata]|nr:hypothetical protein C8R43DRAFT_965704 [Mycena crocata]
MSMSHVCKNCGYKSSLKLDNTSPLLEHVFRPEITGTEDKRVVLEALKVKIKMRRHEQECELAALQGELQELESDLARLSFPVLTLPNEITSNIFVECLVPSPDITPPRVRPSPAKAPLLVSQICRHWRDVAVATGELWNSLDLQLYRVDGASTDGAANLLECWFSRAKGHPLALTLRAYGQEIPANLFAAMLSYSGRLRCLELDISEDQFVGVDPVPSFPILQVLRTRFETLEVELSTPMRELIRNSPQLRFLGFHPREAGYFFPQPDLASVSAARFLSALMIDEHITIETFCTILATLPLLTFLKCKLFDEGPDVPTSKTFPTLTGLWVDLAVCAAPANQLEWLTLPGLSGLELPQGKAHPPLPFITALLVRSKCTLKRLALPIEGADMAQGPLAELFAAYAALHGLFVCTDKYTDLGAFMCALHSPGALPQLTHLAFGIPVPFLGLDYDGLIDLARYRRTPGRAVALRALGVDMWDIPEEGEEEGPLPRSPLPGPILTAQLQGEIDTGLQVNFRFHSAAGIEMWPQRRISLSGISVFEVVRTPDAAK